MHERANRIASESDFRRQAAEADTTGCRGRYNRSWRPIRPVVVLTFLQMSSARDMIVCILSYLGFDNAEISTLTKASLNSISNARTSLARELFNLRSARELNRYLHEI